MEKEREKKKKLPPPVVCRLSVRAYFFSDLFE